MKKCTKLIVIFTALMALIFTACQHEAPSPEPTTSGGTDLPTIYYATMDNLASVAASLPFDATIIMTGTVTSSDIPTIRTLLNNHQRVIKLDLSGVTGLTSIPDNGFTGLLYLQSISLPEGLLSIGSSAFSSCSKLYNVKLPQSLTTINGSAFNRCQKLRNINLPDGITTIGNSAFYFCDSLTQINIPAGINTIPDLAFAYCRSLGNLTIPDNITSIESSAFRGCGSASITIPATVITIGQEAFADCLNLQNIIVDSNNQNYCSDNGILYTKDKSTLLRYPEARTTLSTLPSSVEKFNEYSFSYCKLTDVTIPDTIKRIEAYTFNNSSLKTINIPATVEYLAYNSFGECLSLTNINIDSNNPNYCSDNGVFFNKTKTALYRFPAGRTGAYTVPNGVTQIFQASFSYSNIESLTFPDSIQSIANYSIANCKNLSSLTIPVNVTSIEYQAIVSCENLAEITIKASSIRFYRHSIEYCPKLNKVTFTEPTGWYTTDDSTEWSNKTKSGKTEEVLTDPAANATIFNRQTGGQYWYK